MKIEHKLFVCALAVGVSVPALAGENGTPTTQPLTEMVKPAVTPPGGPSYAGAASAAGGIASLLAKGQPLVLEYGANKRIDADIQRSLTAAEPRIREALEKSGDKGVLVTARHEKSAAGGFGIRGEKTRLLGEVAVGGTGAHPILAKMKTASVEKTFRAGSQNVEETPGYVPAPEFNRMYWVDKGPDGKLRFRAVNVDKLQKAEIFILTNKQMSAAVEQLNYAEGLTSRIRLVSVNMAGQQAGREAATLLKEREQAFKDADEVDRWLTEELGRAQKANKDAEAMGNVSAGAGAAATAYGSSGGGSKGKSAPPTSTSTTINVRNNVLIKDSNINTRSESFLRQQGPQPGVEIRRN